MEKVVSVKEILSVYKVGDKVCASGWIRNHRKQNVIGFIDFFDGSVFESIQIVYDKDVKMDDIIKGGLKNFEAVEKLHIGSAITVSGEIVQGRNGLEIQAKEVVLEGDCPEDYPLQPKKHTLEFLREIAYLRPRTRLFQAVFRVRSEASFAIHEYFKKRGYLYLHSPIITANDCEGAGNAFTVTTLDAISDGKGCMAMQKGDHSKDFFGKKTALTVSGQLEGETFAMAFGKIYTFGPTFRAENSNTKTHVAEFWMIEPEIAFCDLSQLMDIEEDFLKYLMNYILENCKSELTFLSQYNGFDVAERLVKTAKAKIARVTHKDAIDILINAVKKGVKFQFEPKHGEDLAREHEKYLTDTHFGSPVFVYNWPKDIKAFYMYCNDDGKTVGAVDLLVPGAGELMGGSQRETRFDVLTKRMKDMDIPEEDLHWYLNLRKFGGCTHAGFGMGFERLIMFLTGMENIRDVIPYARTPKNCEF